MNDVAQAQIAEAERALRERAAAARNQQPEYTLVKDPYCGIGIYTRTTGMVWSLSKVHDGEDIEGLARALRLTGAPVFTHTDIYDLAMQGTFEPTVERFVASPESVRCAARAAYLFREADRREAEWANNDRWGDSGANALRHEAGYALARVKELNPGYKFKKPKKAKQPRPAEPPKGWYLSG